MACEPWKFWNQLDDWNVDADGGDENRINNCGPECCAMILWHLRGVEMSADQLKDWLLGPERTGNTTLAALKRLLTFHNVRASFQTADPIVISQYAGWGQPVILLQQGMVEPRNAWHFVVAIDADDDGALVVANPWGGTRDTITADDWARGQRYPVALFVEERKCGWGVPTG